MYILLAALLLALPSINELYKGQEGRFLLAGPDIQSGPFHEAIVYIYKNKLFGSGGFIINKPLNDEDIAGLPEAVRKQIEGSRHVRMGGPVRFSDAIAAFKKDRQTYYFLGYAGWAPLQLEYEILRGSWQVQDADRALIFTDRPERLWDRFKSLSNESPDELPDL